MVDIEDDSFRIATTQFTSSVRLACGSAHGYQQMFPYGNTDTHIWMYTGTTSVVR